MKWLHPLRRVPVADVLAEQLFEADRLGAEHLASAEHHAALAGMYLGRAQRIRKQQAQQHSELRAVK